MLKNGMTAQAEITDYTADGDGVCRIEGCAVFVPNAIAGEVCEIKIVKAGKTSAVGKIERILEKSPHRIPRACPYAKQCGGCRFQHMDYAEETALKQARVKAALERIGGIHFGDTHDNTATPDTPATPKNSCHPEHSEGSTSDIPATPATFLPVIPASQTESYRNKAQYPVAAQKGKPAAGFYKERTHQVVPIDRCLILPREADEAKGVVVRWMEQYHISAYDETTGKGLIRHIYVRKGFISKEILVCLVANGSTLPHTEELLSALQSKVRGLKSVVLSVNQKPGNAVLGDRFVTLYGDGTIEDTLCSLRFRLSPRSFYQVNHDQAERLYAAAVKAADLTGTETVLDLYCGTGTITLCLAKHAGKAYGVEIIEQAIEDAKENARRNGIENAEFFCADAGQAAQRFAAEGIHPEVIVIDPPRKGVTPDVIDAMAQMAPRRIVYVSCDPATLARDVKLLTAQGYTLQTAQPFDLFPRTAHVETVVQLVRKRPDDYVRVEMNMEDFDLTESEAKATYKEIKAYVKDQTGLNVSNLDIAQTKRKSGIIERKNYNILKSEDAKQPKCTQEKEDAIIEALEHFRMI